MAAHVGSVFIAIRGARLRAIRGIALLSVAERERLFEASPATVSIWPMLEVGVPVSDLRAAASSDPQSNVTLLAELLDAGAIEEIGTDEGAVPVASRVCIDLGDLTVCLNFAGRRAAEIARSMLGHLETPLRPCHEQLVIVETPDAIGVARCGGPVDWAPWEQAGPSLKVALTDLSLACLPDVALHVATLSAGDEALLIVGAPGAGKSTLSVALGRAGFRLEGDDIAALEPDGQVRALPFPATLKDGAWPLVARLCPELEDCPAFVRPDDQRVRYLPLESPGAPPARKVRCVLSLCRDEAATAALDGLGVKEGFAALIEGAWSRDKRLSPAGFEALATCVEGAAFFRLTFPDLDSAIPLVETAWRRAMAERESQV